MSASLQTTSEPLGHGPVLPKEDGTDEIAEYISFSIGDHQYGVPIMSVREIKGWSGANPLPNQPEYVRGVLNLRGVMVPIIDLRCRFAQGETQASARHVVIIVSIDDRLVGILADRVLDIVSFGQSAVQLVPNVGSRSENDFVSGLVTLDDGMMALINLHRLCAGSAVG